MTHAYTSLVVILECLDYQIQQAKLEIAAWQMDLNTDLQTMSSPRRNNVKSEEVRHVNGLADRIRRAEDQLIRGPIATRDRIRERIRLLHIRGSELVGEARAKHPLLVVFTIPEKENDVSSSPVAVAVSPHQTEALAAPE